MNTRLHSNHNTQTLIPSVENLPLDGVHTLAF